MLRTSSNLRQIAIRAAIDFGSGAVKMQVSKVNVDENRLICGPLLSKYTPLLLTEDVATHQGYISDEMQDQSLRILRQFKEEAVQISQRENRPLSLVGIATGIFRHAKNGADLLEQFENQLNIKFHIVSHQEEGRLGFMTAKALFADRAEDHLLVWDSGNGSFQMTAKEIESYNVYFAPLGHGTLRVLLSKEIRNGPVFQHEESGNPISQEEVSKLVEKMHMLLPPIPEWLNKKICSEDIVVATFGEKESVFARIARMLSIVKKTQTINETTIFLSDVQDLIARYLGKNDTVFNDLGVHGKTLTNALLLHTVMEHFAVQKIHFKAALGNTSGMLISPLLWNQHA